MVARLRWVGLMSWAALACGSAGFACARAGSGSAHVTPPALGSASAPSASIGKASQAAPAMPGKNVPAIKVDTVGYPTEWRKIAIFNVEPRAAVVKDESGKIVLTFAANEIV